MSETERSTMAGDRAEEIPFEIRDAIEALDGVDEQAIVVTLLNEGKLAFSQLKDQLDMHQQSLTNALDSLLEGGVVRKRSSEDPSDRYGGYYEMTEFGERFMDRTLEALGSVNSGRRPEAHRQKIENIHNVVADQPAEVPGYNSSPDPGSTPG